MREGLGGPADRAVHGDARRFVADGIRGAFIEDHHDVASKSQLDIDGGFRREAVSVAVQMRLEGDAGLGDLAQPGEAEYLEAAGIREDRAGPRHEFVQAAQLPDSIVTGPEEEVVGVGENDGGSQILPKVTLGEAFDRGLGADRHEYGRRDIAVCGVQDACAGARMRAFRL